MSHPCPTCRSADLRRVDATSWRCNACDTLFDVVEDAPRVREAGRVPSPRESGGRVALAVFALVAAAAGAFLLSPDAEVSEPVDVVADGCLDDPGRLPEIDLPHQRAGRTAEGHAFWLLTYRNLSPQPLERPAAIAKLFDAGGNVVAWSRGEAAVPRLDPGDETVILVVVENPPAWHREEVMAEAPRVAEGASAQVPVGVRVLGEERTGAGVRIRGTLSNLDRSTVQLGGVVLVGRDADGVPVAWARGRAEADQLAPRESTSFVAESGPWSVAAPAVWTGVAQGELVEF